MAGVEFESEMISVGLSLQLVEDVSCIAVLVAMVACWLSWLQCDQNME